MIANIRDLQISSEYLNIVSPFSFNFYLGDIVAVLAQDISSVREFIAILMGRLSCSSGNIEINGCDVREKGARKYYNWVPIIAKDNLISLTVEQYLNFSAELYGMDRHYRPYLVNESLRLTGIEQYKESVLSSIREIFLLKKIELARSLVSNPYVIFIDDLFQECYDDKHKAEIVQILQNIRNTGCCLIVGVDSLEFIKDITNKIIFFVENKIFLCGEFKDIYKDLNEYKLVQVQLLDDGLDNMLDILEERNDVWEILQREDDIGVLKFIFKGNDQDLTNLLQEAVNRKCGIVSCYSLNKFWGR